MIKVGYNEIQKLDLSKAIDNFLPKVSPPINWMSDPEAESHRTPEEFEGVGEQFGRQWRISQNVVGDTEIIKYNRKASAYSRDHNFLFLYISYFNKFFTGELVKFVPYSISS